MPKRPTQSQRQKLAFKQALNYLGIRGKRRSNPITSARFLGFTPLRRGVPINPNDPLFAKRVNDEIFRRWVENTQKVSQSITINFKYRYKKSTKIMKGVNVETITGTRATIDKLRMDRINEMYDELEQDSPFVVEEAGEAIVSGIQRLPVGAGNRFVSKGVRQVRMKKLGALKLDYDYIGDAEWDRQKDTCVFDWLFYEYADVKGLKKFLPKNDREYAYNNLNELFKEFDGNDDPLTDGVNIDQLTRFAEKFSIPLMGFDKNEKTIVCYRPEKENKSLKTILFIIANAHFYPIVDKSKRASLACKVREENKDEKNKYSEIQNWASEDFEIAPKEEEGGEEGKEPPEPIFPTDDECVGNEYVMSIIKETKTIPRKIQVEGSKIVRFNIGDQKYYTSPKTELEERLETYYKEKGEIYWGQSPNYMMSELYKEEYEDDFYKVGLSRFNPMVYDLLMDAKVKHRQHYGATRDNTDLMELVDAEFEERIVVKEIDIPYKDIFTGEQRIKKDTIRLREQVAKPRQNRLDKLFENGQAVCYDLNKHYTSCLRDAYDDFLIYDEEDTMRTFKQDIKKPLPSGIYYVETNDLSLLHQSNWYSNKIIDLAIKEGIELKIKYELLPIQRYTGYEKLLPKDYFKKFIDKAFETPFGKEIVNTFIGSLGKTTIKSKIVECDTDADLVWESFVNCE